jgi:hypothetical protein
VFARIHPKRLIRQNPSDVAWRGKVHPEATMTQAASKYAVAFVAKFNGRCGVRRVPRALERSY